jgi:hypothetical protein
MRESNSSNFTKIEKTKKWEGGIIYMHNQAGFSKSDTDRLGFSSETNLTKY